MMYIEKKNEELASSQRCCFSSVCLITLNKHISNIGTRKKGRVRFFLFLSFCVSSLLSLLCFHFIDCLLVFQDLLFVSLDETCWGIVHRARLIHRYHCHIYKETIFIWNVRVYPHTDPFLLLLFLF